jgi:hypothetical protein
MSVRCRSGEKERNLCSALSAVGSLNKKNVISNSYPSDFSDFYGYTE